MTYSQYNSLVVPGFFICWPSDRMICSFPDTLLPYWGEFHLGHCGQIQAVHFHCLSALSSILPRHVLLISHHVLMRSILEVVQIVLPNFVVHF